MQTYKKSEIVNKHNQYIVYFSKQPGNNELEQCINFNKGMASVGVKCVQYNLKDSNGSDIYCVVGYDLNNAGVEVFNSLKEKIYQSEDGDLYDESEDAVIELLTDMNII